MKRFLSTYGLWILLLATALIYLPSLKFTFIYGDEYFHLLTNADLLHSNLRAILTKEYVGMYQPLTSLYYWAVFRLFGLNPIAYHALGILLHLLNISLVYGLIFKFSGRKNLSLLTAALFALQPGNAETIVWISAVSNLWSTAFMLSALWLYWQAKSKKAIIGSFVLGIIAMLFKPSAIIFPLLLLLLDFRRDHKFNWRQLWIKTPLWLAALAMGLATIAARRHDGHFVNTLTAYSFIQQLVMYAFSYSYYLFNSILPLYLTPAYLYPALDRGWLPWYYYAGALAACGGLALIIIKKYYRQYWFWLAWFVLNLILTVRLRPIGRQIITNRYSYLAGLAVYYALALIFLRFLKQAKWRHLTQIGLAGYLVLLATISFFYSQSWQDDYTLNNTALAGSPSNPEAGYLYDNRANAEAKLGMAPEALADFNQALALNPALFETLNNRGILKADSLQDPQGALADFSQALRLQPGRVDFYYNRGSVLATLKQWPSALADFDKAINGLPAVPPSYHHNRGNVLLALGKFQAAIDDYSQTLRAYPNALTYLQRGQAYWSLKLKPAACADWQQAKELGSQPAAAKLQQSCR